MKFNQEGILAQEVNEFMDKVEPYYDSVLVLATYRKNGETFSQIAQRGNSFATEGLVNMFVEGRLEIDDQEEAGE